MTVFSTIGIFFLFLAGEMEGSVWNWVGSLSPNLRGEGGTGSLHGTRLRSFIFQRCCRRLWIPCQWAEGAREVIRHVISGDSTSGGPRGALACRMRCISGCRRLICISRVGGSIRVKTRRMRVTQYEIQTNKLDSRIIGIASHSSFDPPLRVKGSARSRWWWLTHANRRSGTPTIHLGPFWTLS